MSKKLPTFTKVSLTRSGKQKIYTEEEKQRHCELWRQSDLSMSKYCQKSKLAVSSLSKWVKELAKNKKLPMLKPAKGTKTILLGSKQKLEIILTSGMRLRFPEVNNFSDLVPFIRKLNECD